MRKAFFVLIVSAQLLAAQSVGIGINGGWTQVRSTPTLSYYNEPFSELYNNQSTVHLTSNGPTIGLGIQLNLKGGYLSLNSEAQYSRLSGKTDSLRIFPPPYS